MKFNIIDSSKLLHSERWDSTFHIKSDSIQLSSKFPLVRIGDVVIERKGFIEPQNHLEHIFNYVGLENISQKTRVLVEFAPKNGSDIKSRCKIYREGDILFGRLRPKLNKVLKIGDQLKEGICSTEIFVLSPINKSVNPIYLEEILSSEWVQNEVERLAGGATLPRISINDFFNIKIPLPKLPIQAKIANFINKNREQWLIYSHKTADLPVSIKDAVCSYIAGDGELKKYNSYIQKNVWDNPLPNLELNDK